ncbi:Putative serine/threonine-protein kinase [Glycine soja]|nr:Putative serine/threonine-protein kinase [Glycine soja]
MIENGGQAEREFKVEVEAIGRVRHKNLVRLLGYCVEGEYRMLVYEYVNNGNLEQWLHGDAGPVSPMTWDIRMNIILGTAKGYYIHGLAGIHCYVAPEYACTGMLTEKSDVYSFGILIMEIITGRSPVDYSKPQGEVNLIEWLKSMVGNRKSEEVVDPKIAEKPSSRALKRALLVALRCVDPDAAKRPKIGHVIHMLEAEDLLFRDDRRSGGESSRSHRDYQLEHKDSRLDKRKIGGEITDQSEDDSTTSSRHHPQPTRWR